MNTFNKDTDIRTYRREVIVRLHKKGMRQHDITEVVGCSQGLVSQVWEKYQESGEQGIASKPHPGASPLLDTSEKQQLACMIDAGAQAYGFESEY